MKKWKKLYKLKYKQKYEIKRKKLNNYIFLKIYYKKWYRIYNIISTSFESKFHQKLLFKRWVRIMTTSRRIRNDYYNANIYCMYNYLSIAMFKWRLYARHITPPAYHTPAARRPFNQTHMLLSGVSRVQPLYDSRLISTVNTTVIHATDVRKAVVSATALDYSHKPPAVTRRPYNYDLSLSPIRAISHPKPLSTPLTQHLPKQPHALSPPLGRSKATPSRTQGILQPRPPSQTAHRPRTMRLTTDDSYDSDSSGDYLVASIRRPPAHTQPSSQAYTHHKQKPSNHQSRELRSVVDRETAVSLQFIPYPLLRRSLNTWRR